MEQFHFLRPGWMLLLIPLVLLIWRLWGLQRGGNSWRQLIAPGLLSHLLDQQETRRSHRPLIVLSLAWIIAIIALSGPSWKKLPQPVYQKQDAVVMILDLSPSMLAEDQKPTRLVHARHRLIDMLKSRREGLTGLVVYGGDAHVLAPLSSDRETLLALVPSLSPVIMPLRGSRAEAATAAAIQLLKDAGQSRGRLILITDGIEAEARESIQAQLSGNDYSLSILGMGTPEGAPIPLRDGSFAKDSQGRIYLARLESQGLKQLALASGGRYSNLSFTGEDIEQILSMSSLPQAISTQTSQATLLERDFDIWEDAGFWLLLLLLPIAALSHRRGWLLLVLVVPMLNPQPVYAFEWQDLWKTSDQRAAEAFSQQQYENAEKLFQSPAWKGSAQYRKGDYTAAEQSFATGSSANDRYNRANALARDGKLKEALEAYDKTLELAPEMEDARFNKQLVEDLLKQQQEQQNQQDGQQQSQDQNDQQQGEQQQGDQGQSKNQQGQQQPSDKQSEQESDSQGESANPSEQSSGSGNSSEPEPQPKKSEQQSSQADGDSPANNEEQHQSAASDEDRGEASDSDTQALSEQSTEEPPEELSEEQRAQQQALEKWLRQLPDDPSGLLRRKFQYQYRQKLEAYQRGEWQPPEEIRW